MLKTKLLAVSTILSFVCCFAYSAELPEKNKIRENIAVIDFEGKDISASQASVFTGFLRTELVKTDSYNVVEKSNMEKVLQEVAFQQTGVSSTDDAVKLGKILNARKMIFGTLSRIKDAYYSTANLVDVETGQIERSESLSCEQVEDLKGMAEDIADVLVSESNTVVMRRLYRRWFAVSMGNPYISAVFNIGKKVGIEGRFATDLDLKFETNYYALRFYWYFRKPKYNTYIAAEYGPFNFQGYKLYGNGLTTVNGYMAGIYPGIEYFISKNLSINGDMGASYINMNDVITDIDIILNLGVRIYIY